MLQTDSVTGGFAVQMAEHNPKTLGSGLYQGWRETSGRGFCFFWGFALPFTVKSHIMI